MKKPFLLLCIPLLLASLPGCMIAYPPPPRQLVDIPLRPHRHDVKIYLEGEQPENPDYYKVIGLDVPVGYGNFNDKLNAFKLQGQRIGVDAILLLGSAQTYEYGPVPFGSVNAIGIKYRDSLNYITEYLKRKDVYLYQPDGSTALVYQADFTLRGEDQPGPDYRRDTVYRRYVQRYALDFLLHATAGWRFRTDARGNITQRTKYHNDILELTSTFKYNTFDNVSEITLVSEMPAYPQRQRIRERMVLRYDQSQQVTEKLIYNAKNQPKFRETVAYDRTGRVQGTTLYAIRGAEEVPLLTTVHHYHTLDDLPPITKGL